MFASRIAAGFVTISLSGFLAPQVATAETKTLIMLDKGEAHEALAFHAGLLWVGQSRKDFASNYRVTIFDRSDAQVAEVQLRHSATFLYPYDDSSVLVVGTAASPNLTHYTIVRHQGGNRFTTEVHQVPMEAWAYGWIGRLDDKEFFTDFSGNTEDPDRDRDPNLPSQTIFTMTSFGRARYQPYRMAMPIVGAKVGRTFYVVHRYQIGHPASNLVAVSPDSGTMRTFFEARRDYLTDVKPFIRGTLALSELGTSKVLIFDPAQGAVVGEAPTKGGPRSLATLGACVLAGNEQQKTVVAVRVDDVRTPKPILSLDFTGTGTDLRAIKKIAVDQETGRVYARSSFPCNPMVEDCSVPWNSIAVLDHESSGKVLDVCRLNGAASTY